MSVDVWFNYVCRCGICLITVCSGGGVNMGKLVYGGGLWLLLLCRWDYGAWLIIVCRWIWLVTVCRWTMVS